MTIEELLTVALEHVGMADAAADGSLGLETAGQHAAIAQAAATTAQAMILRDANRYRSLRVSLYEL